MRNLMNRSDREKIEMLRNNLEENEVNYNFGTITKAQYTTRKMDARRAISRIKNNSKKQD